MPIKFTDITNILGITNVKEVPTVPVQPAPPVESEYVKKEVLFEWDTVTRSKAIVLDNPKENRTLIVIGVVIALILILTQNFLLIAVIASLIFLRYVLSATPGESVQHKLLNIGVDYNGNIYEWHELKQFFFTQDTKDFFLCIDTFERLPGRLYFILNSSSDKEKIRNIVEEYIPYLEEEPQMLGNKLFENAVGRISLSSKKE